MPMETDPIIQFGNAGVDDEQAAQAVREARAALAAFQAAALEAWERIQPVLQEIAEAMAEIGRQFVKAVVETFTPIIDLWRRRILYARLSEHLPGWLARLIAIYCPRRWLPMITDAVLLE